MSIVDPLTCGFMKVFCHNLFTQTKNNTSHTPGNPKHNQSVIFKGKVWFILKTFPWETHGTVEYRTFVNNFKKIVTNMQYLGRSFHWKTNICWKFFLLKIGIIWMIERHCIKYLTVRKDALAVFPTKNPNKKMKAKQNYFKSSYEGDIQQIKLNLGQSTTLPLQNRRKII